MALRDLALTVLELEPHEYHWVLMEAVQAESEDCLGYRPVDSSTRGLPDYSEALIQGASALRALQGLAPFGPAKAATAASDKDGAGKAPNAQPEQQAPIEDSLLFTTGNSSL